jgi:hypothetical protein
LINALNGRSYMSDDSTPKGQILLKLEEADRILRAEIKHEACSGTCKASNYLAALMRTRADVQSAITNLLDAGA